MSITVTLSLANAAALSALASAISTIPGIGIASAGNAVASTPSAATAPTAAPTVTAAPVTAAPVTAAPTLAAAPTPAVDLNTLGALLQGKAQSNPAGFAALMQHYGFTSMQAIQGAPDKWAALHADAQKI